MKTTLLKRARTQLGLAGLAGLALLAAGLVFLNGVLQPLEARARAIESRLAAAVPAARASAAETPAAKLAEFYRHFETGERATDWLARLHQLAQEAGVELAEARYTLHETGTRLDRYEVVLPITGTYPQIRQFLRGTLAAIPVASLDQLRIRRESAGEGRVQAEARLTLHLVRS